MQEYGELIPKELIREHLLMLQIEDIIRNRRISKEFKGIIDENSFWDALIKRDYPNLKYSKDRCKNTYIALYINPIIKLCNIEKTIKMNVKLISELILYLTQNSTNLYLDKFRSSNTFNFTKYFIDIIERLGFKNLGNIWYYNMKQIFDADFWFNEWHIRIINVLSTKRKIKDKTMLLTGNTYTHDLQIDFNINEKIDIIINSFLPKYMFIRNGELHIKWSNLKKIYDKIYNEGSFDKKLLETASDDKIKYLLRRRHCK